MVAGLTDLGEEGFPGPLLLSLAPSHRPRPSGPGIHSRRRPLPFVKLVREEDTEHAPLPLPRTGFTLFFEQPQEVPLDRPADVVEGQVAQVPGGERDSGARRRSGPRPARDRRPA